MAIRWLLQKDYIPSVIIGAKSIEQPESNMGAASGWKITDEQVKTASKQLLAYIITYKLNYYQILENLFTCMHS